MRKKIFLTLLIIFTLIIVGCNKETKYDFDGTLEYEGVNITPGTAFDEEWTTMSYMKEEVSSDTDIKEEKYIYEDIDIVIKVDGDNKIIESVQLTEPSVVNNEGISIESNLKEVKKVYGNDYEETEDGIVYTVNNIKLIIYTFDDEIESIKYELNE